MKPSYEKLEDHHKVITFEEEYLKFLDGCKVKYGDRFVLG